MRQTNHFITQKHSRLSWIQAVVLLFAVVTAVHGTGMGTLTYLVDSDNVTNIANPATPGVTILETFDSETKEKVYVQNTGDLPVYARATYVAYWVSDADGSILPEVPALTVTMGSATNWKQMDDGYWYCRSVLNAGETSKVFIVRMSANKIEGRHLVVDVIVETVQALGVNSTTGKTPVEDLWGVSADSFISE